MDADAEQADTFIEFQRINYDGPPEREHNIFLDSPELVVGRSPTMSTLIIPDPLISRQHVRFNRQEDGTWTITDLSLNGVLLNGRRLTSRQPTPFSANDTLQLDQPGKYQYRAVQTTDRPPPAKRAFSGEEYVRRLQEKSQAAQKEKELKKQREIEEKQREIERQKEVEARVLAERQEQEARLREAAARLQEEKEREEAMRREAEQQEAKIKEEKERLEAQLRKMQEELTEQQAQAEQAAKEREEYEKRMLNLKEEMEKREQEVEKEKRLREQLEQQEADLKNQLAAEVQRLEQERRDIEQQLKGLDGAAAVAALLALARKGRRGRSHRHRHRHRQGNKENLGEPPAAADPPRPGSPAEGASGDCRRSWSSVSAHDRSDYQDADQTVAAEATAMDTSTLETSTVETTTLETTNLETTVLETTVLETAAAEAATQETVVEPMDGVSHTFPRRSDSPSRPASLALRQRRRRSVDTSTRKRKIDRLRGSHQAKSPQEKNAIESPGGGEAPPVSAAVGGDGGAPTGAVEYPCGVCGRESEGTDCVACDGCDVWHHMRCLKMDRRARRQVMCQDSWYCRRCRGARA
ncbi:stress response protein nst1-like isoform X3 [Amphibalanus amphitrite]|nr:stress response protein nst1-like isoform X3 [Amphibalanus amphitrite]XP_043195621.1 stress response protein nst1-like isoform X3 [Amphibalanus amphitrite]XP_043195623.1 stress response protein nst1-like isoform X3 [Amphibalanus amphitrite]XP_043195624.1 stress response protein nst1-like isoform X3 [Amphibalanus amphitrite]